MMRLAPRAIFIFGVIAGCPMFPAKAADCGSSQTRANENAKASMPACEDEWKSDQPRLTHDRVRARAIATKVKADEAEINLGGNEATIFAAAEKAESKGDYRAAMRDYRRVARAGEGRAARRLGDIYDKGLHEVTRDPVEALYWYYLARELGVNVDDRIGKK